MFDTSAQKNEQTVLEKGVRSWVAFGMNIKGQSREMDLATVVKHNVFKNRFKRKFRTLNPNRWPSYWCLNKFKSIHE